MQHTYGADYIWWFDIPLPSTRKDHCEMLARIGLAQDAFYDCGLRDLAVAYDYTRQFVSDKIVEEMNS